MQRWIGYIFGFVTVEIVGDAHERMMNLCAVYNRDVWDYTVTNQTVTVRIRASEFKNLRKAAKRAGVRLKILEKHGLPFLLRGFRFRCGMVTGLFLFCLILWFLSGRVWAIRFHGEDEVLQQQVLEQMDEMGINLGIKTRSYDWATVRQQVMSVCPEVAWMSMNPIGSVLNVDISRTTKPPELANHKQPSNLIALHDGTVLSMNIKSGSPMVRVGDGVVKGDLLVSGAVEYSDGCTVFRQAQAEILAQTTHKITVRVPLKQTNFQSTGKRVERYGLCFFGLKVPLYIGSVDEPYEVIQSYSPVVIQGTLLPIGIQRGSFELKRTITVQLTQEEAMVEAVERVDDYIKKELTGCEILDIDYQKKFVDPNVEVTAKILCKENIAFEEKMLIF
ncbi:MAG: sporulation protein YqfD [Clostridia bacterium]|nr:sporulation protein YqfD [Clostridia bacterium]